MAGGRDARRGSSTAVMQHANSMPPAAADKDFAAVVAVAREHGIMPRRRPLQWVAGSLVLFLAAFAVNSVATNKALEWGVIGRYFLNDKILSGLYLTLWVTFLVTLGGFVLGTVLAVMRISSNPVLRTVSWTYIWIFRSTPLLVQLLFWFNIAYMYPTVSFGVPFGPTFFAEDSRALISTTTAAIIALTTHDAAYACEIVRGGILSVDQGQADAAKAIGLQPFTTFRRVVLPQAMRPMLPAAVNLLIMTLKGTSIVSIISVVDLLYSAQLIYNRTYQVMPLLMVATIWYIIVCSILSVAQYYLERHFARGAVREMPRGLRVRRRGARTQAAGGPGDESSTPAPRRASTAPRLAERRDLAANSTNQIMVRLRDVTKSFASVEVLRGVDLDVPRGGVLCVIGPSGSGKSTMLRCVNRLEKIDSGVIEVDGEIIGLQLRRGRLHELSELKVAPQRIEIGTVFQQFNLFPHMTAVENIVEAPVRVRGLSRREALDRAEDLLDRVGLSGRGEYYPRQLSGGQQQRVAIARALAMQPKVMLFDEPTSSLDTELVGEVLGVMHDLALSGMTMIVVSHEVEFAREVASDVVFMDGGKVVEHGPPDQVLDNPQHPRTQAFLARVLESHNGRQ